MQWLHINTDQWRTLIEKAREYLSEQRYRRHFLQSQEQICELAQKIMRKVLSYSRSRLMDFSNVETYNSMQRVVIVMVQNYADHRNSKNRKNTIQVDETGFDLFYDYNQQFVVNECSEDETQVFSGPTYELSCSDINEFQE
ncbi:Hypothetical_protein [Hexamita inflata]|uniref:Hypothetical_protein n=1 Tax=Hexamita inflata TaxID=28002 RepID=A0AA86TZL8_9EUKA|nr:Hypothetical protein HINF_LOCUS20527 [Hexamita inflata]CAI9934554.1 Hypothetical protein HINF_LOCUS22199 [Hexamita inflata]